MKRLVLYFALSLSFASRAHADDKSAEHLDAFQRLMQKCRSLDRYSPERTILFKQLLEAGVKSDSSFAIQFINPLTSLPDGIKLEPPDLVVYLQRIKEGNPTPIRVRLPILPGATIRKNSVGFSFPRSPLIIWPFAIESIHLPPGNLKLEKLSTPESGSLFETARTTADNVGLTEVKAFFQLENSLNRERTIDEDPKNIPTKALNSNLDANSKQKHED
ncbi:MAG: hypothetical protein J0L93_10760 [Deltaproteobacteria bacterium]|nr:hypothetical protein [Deltaproteobacteria bacterium]